MKHHGFFPVILLASAVLAGCTVGPDYSRPEVPISAAYKHEAGWRSLSSVEAPPSGDWWAIYGDPELDRLMRTTAESNLSVVQAGAGAAAGFPRRCVAAGSGQCQRATQRAGE